MASHASMLQCWRVGQSAPPCSPSVTRQSEGELSHTWAEWRHKGGGRMPGTRQWCFGPFRLDPTTESLWRDEVLLPLPPKPFAVLAYLVVHAGQVVSKETLVEAVWPNTAVTEGVLKARLGQLRPGMGAAAR